MSSAVRNLQLCDAKGYLLLIICIALKTYMLHLGRIFTSWIWDHPRDFSKTSMGNIWCSLYHCATFWAGWCSTSKTGYGNCYTVKCLYSSHSGGKQDFDFLAQNLQYTPWQFWARILFALLTCSMTVTMANVKRVVNRPYVRSERLRHAHRLLSSITMTTNSLSTPSHSIIISTLLVHYPITYVNRRFLYLIRRGFAHRQQHYYEIKGSSRLRHEMQFLWPKSWVGQRHKIELLMPEPPTSHLFLTARARWLLVLTKMLRSMEVTRTTNYMLVELCPL